MKKIFSKKSNFNIKLFFFINFFILLIILDIKKNNFINKFKKISTDCITNKVYMFVLYTKETISLLNKKLITLNELIEENKNLKEEILIQKIKQLDLDNCKKENEILKNLINVDISKKYNYIFAKVISYDFIFSKLIINKGEKDNIFIGQPVLNDSGILGQVISVNKNTSCVMLTCNYLHKIPIKILRNNIRFIINGSGKYETLEINDLNVFLNEDIKEGDLLVSSGLDEKFPEGIPVALISKIKKNYKKFFLNIKAKTVFKIKDIEYLILIKKI